MTRGMKMKIYYSVSRVGNKDTRPKLRGGPTVISNGCTRQITGALHDGWLPFASTYTHLRFSLFACSSPLTIHRVRCADAPPWGLDVPPLPYPQKSSLKWGSNLVHAAAGGTSKPKTICCSSSAYMDLSDTGVFSTRSRTLDKCSGTASSTQSRRWPTCTPSPTPE